MKINTVFITCPGREELLKQTLDSFMATDMRAYLVVPDGLFPATGNAAIIQYDYNTCERKQERQERNSLAALERILQVQPDIILFCEDDIIFNRHLRWNLENWKPLRNFGEHRRAVTPGQPEPSVKEWFFGSLYDPNIRELEMHAEDHYFIADPNAVYGSQCFVMSRAMAEYFVRHWWEVEGMQDIKMSRLAVRASLVAGQPVPIHYHTTSQVQHVGYRSTWTDDNRFHDTKTFELNWKAESII